MNSPGKVLLFADNPISAGDSEIDLIIIGADLWFSVKLIVWDSEVNSYVGMGTETSHVESRNWYGVSSFVIVLLWLSLIKIDFMGELVSSILSFMWNDAMLHDWTVFLGSLMMIQVILLNQL